MKLYRKKLNSLEALKREQLRLRYELKKTSAEELLPFPDLKTLGSLFRSKSGVLPILLDLLTAKSEFQFAVALAAPLLKKWIGKRAKNKSTEEGAAQAQGPSVLKKILREVGLSYTVGKLVLLGISGLKK